jgi:ribosome biogenesis GTPase
VGKSSLLNVLAPGTDGLVSAISKSTGKGVHTTTSVHWIPLAGGGAVIDSPGIRSIQPWGLAAQTLSDCFPEFPGRSGCQFRDCRHREEPGCGIRDAVGTGAVSTSRYESYRRLLEDLS